MKQAWIDANVIVRHLTQDPPDQARQVLDLFRAAHDGIVVLWVDPITIAECVWVLTSIYRLPRGDIARSLADIVAADGIEADDREMLIQALRLYAAHNVDFADALLAARTSHHRVTDIYSFDRDFDRLPNVVRLDPGFPGPKRIEG